MQHYFIYIYIFMHSISSYLPDAGPFGYDPLPPAEHGVLHGRQQEALGGQLQHGVDSLQPDLGPLQLR